MTVLQLTGPVKRFLAHKSIIEMEQTPCSPGFDPNDLWLFPTINSALQGQRFQDIEDIGRNVTTVKAIPKQDFQKSFQQRQHRWAKCADGEREYCQYAGVRLSIKSILERHSHTSYIFYECGKVNI
jgi:hypothetical protein